MVSSCRSIEHGEMITMCMCTPPWSEDKKPCPDTEALLPESVRGLDMEHGLRRVLQKKAVYLSMLRIFLQGQKDAAQQIRLALEANDRETARRIAHTLKGVAGNIGAAELQRSAADVEQEIKAQSAHAVVAAALPPLEATLSSLISELAAKLPPEKEILRAAVDTDLLQDVCRELARLLRSDNAAAVLLIEGQRTLLGSAFSVDFPAIRSAAANYDFETADALLEKAMRNAEISLD